MADVVSHTYDWVQLKKELAASIKQLRERGLLTSAQWYDPTKKCTLLPFTLGLNWDRDAQSLIIDV
jgi:hypothetical protein